MLDLGQYLAGPFGPMILSDLGAEVIKVEPVTGDAMRLAAAPFVGCQRGKRSIALDLRTPEGLEVLYALVERADVVHHNMTKGTAARLGVDEETLKKYKPDLVYCNTYAYGAEGPLSHSGGLDPLYQASCGLEYEAGPVHAGNPPLYIRMGMCDTGNALLSVLGVLLALYRRGEDGEGQSVTTSLLNAGAVFSSGSFLTRDRALCDFPPLDKAQTGMGALYRLYRTFDGWIQVAAVGPGAFRGALLGARMRGARIRRRGSDRPSFGCATARRSRICLRRCSLRGHRSRCISISRRHGCRVRSRWTPTAVRPSCTTRRTWSSGSSVTYEHPLLGSLRQFGHLVNFSATPGRIAGPPPLVGEHSREILAWAGYGPEAVDELKADGVVAWPEETGDYPWSC